MQGIKIPNYIVKEMDNRNRDFFWKSNMDSDYNHGSIALISRDKIYRPKCGEVWESRNFRMSMQLT